jgi:ABC-type glycerol-3-phosphate transport system permease component
MMAWLTRAAIAVVLLLWALPLGWMILASLRPEEALFDPASPASATLVSDHYRALFAERQFWRPVLNSVIVASATTVLALLVAVPCAYAMARLRFRGRTALMGAVLAVSMFPQVSIVPSLFLILRWLGLIDTVPGLVLPYLTFATPLAVWLMVGFFRDLPADLEDAARLDGASRLRAAFEVAVPLAAPAVATTAILTFLYAWNEFLFALSFTVSPDRQTVPVAIALFRGRYQVPWGQILAAAVVASVPVAVVVLAFQRRIVKGLTAGAVKG